jgi:hypothetical protein
LISGELLKYTPYDLMFGIYWTEIYVYNSFNCGKDLFVDYWTDYLNDFL